MTPSDDNDLIDRLRSGIAERQSRVHAPDGIGDDARRAARRRGGTRAIAVGVPVLAAAGVATVLATSGSGGASTGASGARADTGGAGTVMPAVSGGPVRAQDTAYVVKRVTAAVAGNQSGTVTHSFSYRNGRMTGDGALVGLGRRYEDEYDYTGANGILSAYRITDLRADGTPAYVSVTTFSSGGVQTSTNIDLVDHTYDRFVFHDGGPSKSSNPDLSSSSSAIRKALGDGAVTEKGTTTVDGRRAIVLSVKQSYVNPNRPTHSAIKGTGFYLYVDAQTYKPVRGVWLNEGDFPLEVADWVPATTANVAKASDSSVPSGYAKTANGPGSARLRQILGD